jgi:hypothetical protein
MTIYQGLTTVFKQNCLSGKENFAVGTPYTYKIALYTASANLDATTLAYTSVGEIPSINSINATAVANGILEAAVSTQPGLALFGTTQVGGRSLGDINNTGTVTSADALAYSKWAQGVNYDTAQVAWIEGTLNPYIIANPTTYAAYLNTGATGYTAGGKTLTISQVPTSSGVTAYISFANVTWNPASFTTRGALIYNSTTGAAVAVLDFGADKTCSNTFTITFPTASAADAIIRISN